jgi:hypothetical protein
MIQNQFEPDLVVKKNKMEEITLEKIIEAASKIKPYPKEKPKYEDLRAILYKMIGKEEVDSFEKKHGHVIEIFIASKEEEDYIIEFDTHKVKIIYYPWMRDKQIILRGSRSEPIFPKEDKPWI